MSGIANNLAPAHRTAAAHDDLRQHRVHPGERDRSLGAERHMHQDTGGCKVEHVELAVVLLLCPAERARLAAGGGLVDCTIVRSDADGSRVAAPSRGGTEGVGCPPLCWLAGRFTTLQLISRRFRVGRAGRALCRGRVTPPQPIAKREPTHEGPDGADAVSLRFCNAIGVRSSPAALASLSPIVRTGSAALGVAGLPSAAARCATRTIRSSPSLSTHSGRDARNHARAASLISRG